MESIPVTVVEFSEFSKRAQHVWSEKEKEDFIIFIAKYPLVGDEIPGTGGLRKIRWQAKGKGKRGGSRVIYFYFDADFPILLLTVYSKSATTNLSFEQKKIYTQLCQQLKTSIRKSRHAQ